MPPEPKDIGLEKPPKVLNSTADTVGKGDDINGVYGSSKQRTGVFGYGERYAGVQGNGLIYGVNGYTDTGVGVLGESKTGVGVQSTSETGVAMQSTSETNEAVHAQTRSSTVAAIAAYNLNPNGTGAAVFAKKEGSEGHAGFFEGNVWVSNELTVGKDIILANADCAEDFDVSGVATVEAGTVMVLDSEGALSACHKAYDKCVAGVISGAGDYKPGIVLDKRPTSNNRQPIALLGKVFCKVDAQFGAIEVGDLLTTSPTSGHAMKTSDPVKSIGAVIGKALRPLPDGQGLIPILIALQ